ncbi:DUF7563 family protein [Haloarchaeobius sp. DYHT-AS-18]
MPRCQSCGEHVSRAYARVNAIGGVVHECPNCSHQSVDRHLRSTAPP